MKTLDLDIPLREFDDSDFIYGCTGTKNGMTEEQMASAVRLMNWLPRGTFHHGDCKGADAEFHNAASAKGDNIVIHPGHDQLGRMGTRAWCGGPNVIEKKEPLPYLTRDKNIASIVELLIAAPKGFKEELRSGTWATVRYALRYAKSVILVYPDGTIDATHYEPIQGRLL